MYKPQTERFQLGIKECIGCSSDDYLPNTGAAQQGQGPRCIAMPGLFFAIASMCTSHIYHATSPTSC